MVRKVLEILRHQAVGQTWNKSVGQTQRHLKPKRQQAQRSVEEELEINYLLGQIIFS